MSPIRPKAVDGVVVHHPRVAKTPITRRPKKVELSESFFREKEELSYSSRDQDDFDEYDDRATTQSFVQRLRNRYDGGYSSHAGRAHYAVAIIALVALVFYIGYQGNAEVTLFPKEYTKSISIAVNQFEQKEMVISETLSERLPVSGLSDVQEKATGTVTLFNEESAAQKFRAATRLQNTLSKKIYFMENKEIVVPPKVGAKPGSVDVVVIAEKAGPEYNLEKGDFVIPGWAETNNPKYETQYAHSKTAITGGFVGKKPVVDQKLQEAALATLKKSLSKRIDERGSRELPDMWFVLSKGQLVYSEPVIKRITDTESQVSLSVSVVYKIANRIDVGKFVAKQEANLNQYSVVATDTKQLSFDGTKLEGLVVAKPIVPEALYKQKLLGKKKSEIMKVFSELPELSGMEIKVNPVWKRALPKNPSKIIIKS